MNRAILGLLGFLAWSLPAAAQDWPEHRGGPDRAGSIDGKAGPAAPKILWVYRSKEHFLAPLSVGAQRLLACSLGAFNTGSVRAFDPNDGKSAVWTKQAPLLRFPTVGTPAVRGGIAVFGEGMHQTDGTTLHGLRVSDGRELWRLEIPGELIHIEASPSISGGRIFVGGGNAGVLCVDPASVSLDGKEMPLEAAGKEIDRRWKELSDKYEAEKKKDPDFAIPPNEATLPKPAPKVAWQKGKGSWHVDAPVLVAGDRVYATSAYLDKEKMGERALICLNAADGAELWKASLALNGWGGATRAGALLLVPCSSIRYDPKELAGAKGEVVALKAADGSPAWRRETAGSVLATVAVAGDAAVLCDTSGQIQALDVKTGQPRWTYKAGQPFFAGAAIAGDTVYAADLEGGLHAAALSDGKPRWKLDLAAAAQAPGMVYGAPVVHGGRIFVATSNLEGKHTGGETVIVCIGEGK